MQPRSKTASRLAHLARLAWHYIDVHHPDLCLPLFILPPIALVFLLAEAAYALSRLLA
jgi:hypothetical protein